MGILLTFMFLWNMIGALVLIPALSYFLLRGVGAGVNAPAGDKTPSMTPQDLPVVEVGSVRAGTEAVNVQRGEAVAGRV
jgi:hypothetical protein